MFSPETTAFIFPGQGSQTLGMGRLLEDHYHAAKQVLQEADDALGFSLSQIIQEGPEETLTLTENAQPAILATSIAVVRVLESETGVPLSQLGRLAAGHSLGEYTALVATNAISFYDGVRLVHLRGKAMQNAVAPDKGLMLAVIGTGKNLIETTVAEISDPKKDFVVTIANDNSPGQVVISGHKEAVLKAGETLKTKGAKKLIPLQTSAPFHSPLMSPVEVAMKEAFETIPLNSPSMPIVSNVTAEEFSDSYQIFPLLLAQITRGVRWQESVCYMRDKGIKTLVEIGCGKVLNGLTSRIDKSLNKINIETPKDVQQFIHEVNSI